MELKTKINAVQGKQELEITRDFDLPPELLFKAYTESELIEEWMGTKVLKFENRKYGSYEFETIYNGDIVFKANGVIHEFIENQKIVRTFEMKNMPIGVQLEFLDFEKLTENTSRLNIHIVYKSVWHRDEQLKLPFGNGINMAHNKLQQLFNNFK